MAAAAATALLAILALANSQVRSHQDMRFQSRPKKYLDPRTGCGFQQTCFQVLDRNCFSDENGTLSDTFLDRTGDEEAKVANSENIGLWLIPSSQAIVYGGERAFAVNLIKALFSK